MVIVPIALAMRGAGYIAGTKDGIVTVMGKPASKPIYLLSAQTLVVESVTKSLTNGRYLLAGLDVSKEYLVMVRDPNKEFEPFAWDYVSPAVLATVAEYFSLVDDQKK